MDKQQPQQDNAIEFGEMINLIRSFSSSHRNDSIWKEIKQILWEVERGRRKSKQHFYTHKKFPYFCKRIDAYLQEHDTCRLRFSKILAERRVIGLKMQMLFKPVLLEKIDALEAAFPDSIRMTGNKVSRWELKNKDSQELAHFIKKNFGKDEVEMAFLQQLKRDVQGVLTEHEIALSAKNEPTFKISPDGKHCYFFQSDEAEKWHIINQHFFETNIPYDAAYIPIQLEESLFKKDAIRFATLYKILYPKTKSAIIFARIRDIVAELEDLQGLIRKKEKSTTPKPW